MATNIGSAVEYGNIPPNSVALYKVLCKRVNKGREFTLFHLTEGYEPAGSMARWTDEVYGVSFWVDNARHGQRYLTLDKAQERFSRAMS